MNGSPALWLPFAGYLWACVGYEAIYFQWIPVGLLGSILVFAKRVSWTRMVRGLFPLVAAQACALVWYFVSERIYSKGTQRGIVPDWPNVFLSNLLGLPREALKSTHECAWIFVPALTVWFVLVCLIYRSSLFSVRERKSALVGIGYIVSCLA
jgi:hypothetical protein